MSMPIVWPIVHSKHSVGGLYECLDAHSLHSICADFAELHFIYYHSNKLTLIRLKNKSFFYAPTKFAAMVIDYEAVAT